MSRRCLTLLVAQFLGLCVVSACRHVGSPQWCERTYQEVRAWDIRYEHSRDAETKIKAERLRERFTKAKCETPESETTASAAPAKSPSLPELGDTSQLVFARCKDGSGHIVISAEDSRILSCKSADETKAYFVVSLDNDVVAAVAKAVRGADIDYARQQLANTYGSVGVSIPQQDGSIEYQWTTNGVVVSLSSTADGFVIAKEKRTSTPIMDEATAARLSKYDRLLVERGWARINAAPSVLVSRNRSVESVSLSAKPDSCYMVVVLGGRGVDDADVAVFDTARNALAQDLDEHKDAVTRFCTTDTAQLSVNARAHRGGGSLYVVTYKMEHSPVERTWPSWHGPRPSMPGQISQRPISAEDLYARLSPAVYVVLAERSQGSAVAVTERHLITNCHVLDGSGPVHIKRGDKLAVAYVVRADQEHDRCILSTDDIELQPVHGVRAFSDLRPGETVYALGAPRGQEGSISSGLISQRADRNGVHIIQTSAAISPGSSGGPLFDARGNLIGITSFQRTDAQNINFAIAADEWWR